MLLDIPIGLFLVITAASGFRDGLVRKLVAIAALVAALLLGQAFMHDAGELLVEHLGIDPSNAPMYGYLAIFLATAIAQGLLYKLLTGGYKIGGLLDRVAGAGLGLIHGAMFVSGLLFILAISNTLDKETTADSQLYRPVVNLAPQLLDLAAASVPEAMENLKQGVQESAGTKALDANQQAKKETEKQMKQIDELRQSVRKEPKR